MNRWLWWWVILWGWAIVMVCLLPSPLVQALDTAVLAALSSLGSAQYLQSYLVYIDGKNHLETFSIFTFRPSVDLTLIGALFRQYLKQSIEVWWGNATISLLPGLPVDCSIVMSIDNHSVSSLLSSLTSPGNVVLVPQIQRIALKLHPGAGAVLVIHDTVNSWQEDINVTLISSVRSHLAVEDRCLPPGCCRRSCPQSQ